MKPLILIALAALAIAQSNTSGTSSMATGSTAATPSITLSSVALMNMSMGPGASTAPYSITALPFVIAQANCVWNCLIPIGLADPSGCDDVTNECACLSAPADVLDVLTNCVQTVCTASQSAYKASATSLYESYCTSVFGSMQFAMAFSSKANAAATSSIVATPSPATNAGSGGGASASSTARSSAASVVVDDHALSTPALLVISSFLLMIAL